MAHGSDTGFELDALVERMGAAIVEEVGRSLASSELLAGLNRALDGLAERIALLEGGQADASLRERIAELEREVERLKTDRTDKPKPAKAPPVVPANMPQAPSIANLPFGLSAEPPRRSPPRRRSRTAARPTVIYRTDPRAAAAAREGARPKNPQKAETEAKTETKTKSKARTEARTEAKTEPRPEAPRKAETEPSDAPVQDTAPDAATEPGVTTAICSEPDCDRPVRCRGLCSLHYQRVRYKERKIEAKQETAGPIPMPPPPRRRPASTGGRKAKSGGTKGVFALLYEEKGRRTLAGLINQMKFDRHDLVERLNKQFAGMPGVPLETEDVLRAIHYHKLGDSLRKREGEILCRHLVKQRGSLVKTAQKLKLDADQMQARIDELELHDDVARIRNDFRDDVLQMVFSQRLDLALTREKYLKDLDIEAEVDTSLRDEIGAELAKLDEDAEPEAAGRAVQAALSLDDQRFRRMVRRYDLGDRLGVADVDT